MRNTTNLQRDATEAIQDADFREFWPIKVRKALVRAAQTEGVFPPYAVQEAQWALRAAAAIEVRMNRDIAKGEGVLSQADKRRLASR